MAGKIIKNKKTKKSTKSVEGKKAVKTVKPPKPGKPSEFQDVLDLRSRLLPYLTDKMRKFSEKNWRDCDTVDAKIAGESPEMAFRELTRSWFLMSGCDWRAINRYAEGLPKSWDDDAKTSEKPVTQDGPCAACMAFCPDAMSGDSAAMSKALAENVELRERLTALEGQMGAVKDMLKMRDAQMSDVVESLGVQRRSIEDLSAMHKFTGDGGRRLTGRDVEARRSASVSDDASGIMKESCADIIREARARHEELRRQHDDIVTFTDAGVPLKFVAARIQDSCCNCFLRSEVQGGTRECHQAQEQGLCCGGYLEPAKQPAAASEYRHRQHEEIVTVTDAGVPLKFVPDHDESSCANCFLHDNVKECRQAQYRGLCKGGYLSPHGLGSLFSKLIKSLERR